MSTRIQSLTLRTVAVSKDAIMVIGIQCRQGREGGGVTHMNNAGLKCKDANVGCCCYRGEN